MTLSARNRLSKRPPALNTAQEPAKDVLRLRQRALGLRHSGTLALWHSGTLALWHSGTLALWHSGTLALWHSGTLALWHSGILALCTHSAGRNTDPAGNTRKTL